MKLHNINESAGRPENVQELENLIQARLKDHYEWDAFPNPDGLGYNDPCPKCGRELKNKKMGVGKPKFLACVGKHAFHFADLEPEVQSLLDKTSVPEQPHTCRYPPESAHDEQAIRVGAKHGCKACVSMWDTVIDAGFSDDPVAADEAYSEDDVDSFLGLLKNMGITVEEMGMMTGKDRAALLKRLILTGDRRRGHVPGEFGTGRPAKMFDDDSLSVLYLKMKQQEGMRAGRIRQRDRCTAGHTCGFYPNGKPAANYPLPDPQATSNSKKSRYAGSEWIKDEGLTPGRFNSWFEYSPSDTKRWPVSGLMGWKPKIEFEDVIARKMNCDVCVSRELGPEAAVKVLGRSPETFDKACNNPVSQEYGKLKPYCKEHEHLSPYPAELRKKYGGTGLPDAPKDKTVGGSYKHRLMKPGQPPKLFSGGSTDAAYEKPEFFKEQGKVLETGDSVVALRGKNSKRGPGQIEEVDPSMIDGEPGFLVRWPDGYRGWFESDQIDLVPSDLEWVDDFDPRHDR